MKITVLLRPVVVYILAARRLPRMTVVGMLVGLTGSASAQCLEQRLVAADGSQFADYFGASVAISGDWAIVGARGDKGQGSAYVFHRGDSACRWQQHSRLIAPDGAPDDRFGYAVAIDGNTAIVGATRNDQAGLNAGAAYVFRYNAALDRWQQQCKLTAPDASPDDRFGVSVAIRENRAVIGTLNWGGVQGSGAVYIFSREEPNAGWHHEATLRPLDPVVNDYFGLQADFDGEKVIVGSAGYGGNENPPGAVYVFRRAGANSWRQEAKLLAPVPREFYNFGASVSIHGDVAAVGAGHMENPWSLSMFVFRFDHIAHLWNLEGQLESNRFAAFVPASRWTALEANCAVMGDYYPYGNAFGAIWLFSYDPLSGQWKEVAFISAPDPNGTYQGQFGEAVAIEGGRVIVGDSMYPQTNGAAFVYQRGGADCNANGQCDDVDILTGLSLDANHNGIPDECEPRPGDITGDGVVNVNDLLAVINAWGPCPAPPQACPADIAPPGGDGQVNVNDLLMVINHWG